MSPYGSEIAQQGSVQCVPRSYSKSWTRVHCSRVRANLLLLLMIVPSCLEMTSCGLVVYTNTLQIRTCLAFLSAPRRRRQHPRRRPRTDTTSSLQLLTERLGKIEPSLEPYLNHQRQQQVVTSRMTHLLEPHWSQLRQKTVAMP